MAEFNLKMGKLRKDFLEREAKVYYQTYLEVVDVVKYYAKRQNIGLVLRFNGEPVEGEVTAELTDRYLSVSNLDVLYVRNRLSSAACRLDLSTGRIEGDITEAATRQLAAFDAAVSRRYGVEGRVLKTHGHHAGPAKAVAVALASRLADVSGRAIGLHYGIGSSAIGAIHRRLAGRADVLEAVESLAQQLLKKKARSAKYKA